MTHTFTKQMLDDVADNADEDTLMVLDALCDRLSEFQGANQESRAYITQLVEALHSAGVPVPRPTQGVKAERGFNPLTH